MSVRSVYRRFDVIGRRRALPTPPAEACHSIVARPRPFQPLYAPLSDRRPASVPPLIGRGLVSSTSPRPLHCAGLNSQSMTTHSPGSLSPWTVRRQRVTPAPSDPSLIAIPMGMWLSRDSSTPMAALASQAM